MLGLAIMFASMEANGVTPKKFTRPYILGRRVEVTLRERGPRALPPLIPPLRRSFCLLT